MIPEVFDRVCAARDWSFGDAVIGIPLKGGRSQSIRVETFADDGDDFIRITTTVGAAGALTEVQLRSALGVNHGLAHGALAIREGKLVLTDTFPVRDASPGQVEKAVRFLAATADRYEKALFGTDEN